MTSTFERFLRSFSDEELTAFAQDRARVRPPYWKALRLALRVESDRRDLRLYEEMPEPSSSPPARGQAPAGGA